MVRVPVGNILHLKSMITALPDGSIVYFKDNLPQEAAAILSDHTLIEVPEKLGANIVVLDDNKILISESAKKTT